MSQPSGIRIIQPKFLGKTAQNPPSRHFLILSPPFFHLFFFQLFSLLIADPVSFWGVSAEFPRGFAARPGAAGWKCVAYEFFFRV